MAKALLIAVACAAALAGCGPAPADLLHDASLAALRDGALDEAEDLADRAAAQGGTEYAPLRDFLRGFAALLRAERAAAEAEGPRADATGWDRAIRHATDARDLFARAAAAPPERPEARRNAERAALRLEALARKREAAARSAGRRSVVILPGPQEGEKPGAGETALEPATPGTAAGDLPAEEVLGVLDRLAEKEREKRALRAARRLEGGGAAERDW